MRNIVLNCSKYDKAWAIAGFIPYSIMIMLKYLRPNTSTQDIQEIKLAILESCASRYNSYRRKRNIILSQITPTLLTNNDIINNKNIKDNNNKLNNNKTINIKNTTMGEKSKQTINNHKKTNHKKTKHLNNQKTKIKIKINKNKNTKITKKDEKRITTRQTIIKKKT